MGLPIILYLRSLTLFLRRYFKPSTSIELGIQVLQTPYGLMRDFIFRLKTQYTVSWYLFLLVGDNSEKPKTVIMSGVQSHDGTGQAIHYVLFETHPKSSSPETPFPHTTSRVIGKEPETLGFLGYY